MRLAASSAPVTVKQGAVGPVSVKQNIPCIKKGTYNGKPENVVFSSYTSVPLNSLSFL
jgi:hypothetical protein